MLRSRANVYAVVNGDDVNMLVRIEQLKENNFEKGCVCISLVGADKVPVAP